MRLALTGGATGIGARDWSNRAVLRDRARRAISREMRASILPHRAVGAAASRRGGSAIDAATRSSLFVAGRFRFRGPGREWVGGI